MLGFVCQAYDGSHGHTYRRQQVKWPFDIENFILKQNSQLNLTTLDSIYFALTTENI